MLTHVKPVQNVGHKNLKLQWYLSFNVQLLDSAALVKLALFAS